MAGTCHTFVVMTESPWLTRQPLLGLRVRRLCFTLCLVRTTKSWSLEAGRELGNEHNPAHPETIASGPSLHLLPCLANVTIAFYYRMAGLMLLNTKKANLSHFWVPFFLHQHGIDHWTVLGRTWEENAHILQAGGFSETGQSLVTLK